MMTLAMRQAMIGDGGLERTEEDVLAKARFPKEVYPWSWEASRALRIWLGRGLRRGHCPCCGWALKQEDDARYCPACSWIEGEEEERRIEEALYRPRARKRRL